MKLSYAQHLEDFHLSRAFADQAQGVYVDVGGGHPVADNVSCWFYLQGWRGIVVEPQPELAALYARVRPRDHVECCVLGRTEGEVEFHAVERLHGFSTTVTAFADRAADFGAGYQTRRVPMKTLASVCAAQGITRVDFLKIDVEGAEGEVLAGGDWGHLRPRIILCEALAPGTMAENWQSWEPALLAHGYDFALFDGLNRFYVAKEEPELKARLPRERAEWLVVPHLGHTNRAPFRDDHPDHAVSRDLVGAFLAQLPHFDDERLLALVMHGDSADPDAPLSDDERSRIIARVFDARFPEAHAALAQIEAPSRRDFYRTLVASDHFRVMTGRLAMSYDGGQILD